MRQPATLTLAFLFLIFSLGCSGDPFKGPVSPVKEKVEFKVSEPSITKPLGLDRK